VTDGLMLSSTIRVYSLAGSTIW